MGMEKFYWGHLELVDGEGYELTKAQSIEALREFKAKGGIYQVFVQYNGRDIDDPEQIDWAGFPVEEITTTKEIFEMMIEDWLADHPEEYDDLQIDEPEFDEELGKWTATACDEKATYILIDEDGNIGIYYSGSRR